MLAIIPRQTGRTPTAPFRWKTSDGRLLSPKDMRTTHLFYTLRMIWNNSAPTDKRVGKVKLYRFGSFYTVGYMRNAVQAMSSELFLRKDIPEGALDELEQMARHLRAGLFLPEGEE